MEAISIRCRLVSSRLVKCATERKESRGILQRLMIEAMQPKEEPPMEVLGWIPVSEQWREAAKACIADDEAMTHHSRAATLRGLLERLR